MSIPPYKITRKVLYLISDISKILGQYEELHSPKPSPKLRKQNQIKTIHSSLAIEGNTLSLDQVSAILDQKRVMGPPQEIREVQNAIEVYHALKGYRSSNEKNFLKAHKQLMSGLLRDAGCYRSKSVGILKGKHVTHVAPPAENIVWLMKELFAYLKHEDEHELIKSCVFHYEVEFIHPFEDGNGRMGRLWQTAILKDYHPIFEFLPVESLINDHQKEYYHVLERCDSEGASTYFLEFMLGLIFQSLSEFHQQLRPRPMQTADRVAVARTHFGSRPFSRKDYLLLFKSLSSATASRDLKWGVDSGELSKSGDKRTTQYHFYSPD